MTLHVDVPGGPELRLEHLVLDVNGTLTDHRDALTACHVAVGSILAALDLLLAPWALAATLRP